MYSLNVPLPGTVLQLTGALAPELTGFDSVRDQHTLVLKRFGETEQAATEKRVRQLLEGAASCRAKVSGIGCFPDPPAGPGPVVYLTVESPGLEQLHQQLCTVLGSYDDLEGDAYLPHVTLARGGNHEAAKRLTEKSIEPVVWTVTELMFWNARRAEPTGRISLRQ